MKQLVQRLRDGSMDVLDVAIPDLPAGSVLVQNHFSLISAGTEGGTVSAARKSLIGKAKQRPDQVKQVLGTLRQQGVVQTYRAVSKKLDSYSPLGYSCAGVVLEVGSTVRGLQTGDLVACAGAGYASHAEVVAVPENLCVELPASADLSRAAYNTLGAIALQGVRQADLRLGETCVVIGLGLLGQLTCLILRASGVKAIGLDIDAKAIELALKHCTEIAFRIDDPSIADAVKQATSGINADAAIITAATDSTQPINLAGRLLRKRGTVVVVGAVPTGFDREPDYYQKELSLKMSCSYGPGRYDPAYEEKGLDYPPGFVRWTENRNMQAFQALIHDGAIDLDYMTTHRFDIDHCRDAYELMMNRTEDYLGMLIQYDAAKEHSRQSIDISARNGIRRSSQHGIGFIGAGSYAMSYLLPNLANSKDTFLTGVVTSTGTSSRTVAEKFGFSSVEASAADVISDSKTSTVFVVTRHDSHANYVREALHAGKNVFVEKPLCLNSRELDSIVEAWQAHKPILMVGFNRRFSPLASRIKETLRDGPMSMIYRINAGPIPADSWIQDMDVGGGRIIGEVCHFIDFMIYMNGSLPIRVHAMALQEPSNLNDTVAINLTFENGSIGSVCYYANGPKSLFKEYIEIYKGQTAARLIDFKEVEIIGNRKTSRKKLISQDKGQKIMVDRFIHACQKDGESPIPLSDAFATSTATFSITESLRTNRAVEIVTPAWKS